jgi:sigma-B regulation protein RsbU (phosphoserine phosphatase)
MTSPTPRVLIGEDQQDVQDALHLLLKGAGYAADAASTPDAILTKLDAGKYDLLLMDLNYRRDTTSGSEGLEILGMLRNLPTPPPVIVMTAWGSIELAVQAMHMGARDFIQKPWDNNHLLHLAEKHIGAHRAEQLRKFKQDYELEEAVAVQRRLMPTGLPKLPGIDLAGHCQPAGAIAGDYFDVLQLGDKLGLCIADVIGKGLPAALMMSNLQAAVKVTAADWVQPSELCLRVNKLACRNGAIDKFISFFYASSPTRMPDIIRPSSFGRMAKPPCSNPPTSSSARYPTGSITMPNSLCTPAIASPSTPTASPRPAETAAKSLVPIAFAILSSSSPTSEPPNY